MAAIVPSEINFSLYKLAGCMLNRLYGPRLAHGSIGTVFLVVLVVVGCAISRGTTKRQATNASCEVGTHSAANDRGVWFLAPHALAAANGEAIVVGAPSIRFEVDANKQPSAVFHDDFLGLHFGSNGFLRSIQTPVPGPIEAVRVASVSGDEWAFIITQRAETGHQTAGSGAHVWTATLSNGRWEAVTELRAFGEPLLTENSSDLVSWNGELFWAVGTRRMNGQEEVHVWHNKNDVWSRQTLGIGGAYHLSLSVAPSALYLAVSNVGVGDHQELVVLERKHEVWVEISRLTGVDVFHDPTVIPTSEGPFAVWSPQPPLATNRSLHYRRLFGGETGVMILQAELWASVGAGGTVAFVDGDTLHFASPVAVDAFAPAVRFFDRIVATEDSQGNRWLSGIVETSAGLPSIASMVVSRRCVLAQHSLPARMFVRNGSKRPEALELRGA